MTKSAALAVTIIFASSALAAAHVGGGLVQAEIVRPAPPVEQPAGDGGIKFVYTPAAADASYRIEWIDGDADPTGRFHFYYLPRAIPDALTAAEVEALGTRVRDLSGREAVVYAGCTCDEDAGVTCADPGDGGARWCDNFVDWDTSAVPDGSYSIAAILDDPPFRVYSVSRAPVRVSHGGAPPPLALVVRPSTFGLADARYTVRVIARGAAPLRLDLAYGPNRPGEALGPVTPLVADLPADIANDIDGAISWDWDTSQLPKGTYFVRATVRDGLGRAAVADSRGGVTVLHSTSADAGLDAGNSSDASINLQSNPGCGCVVGKGAYPPMLAPALAAMSLLLALALRRRCRR